MWYKKTHSTFGFNKVCSKVVEKVLCCARFVVILCRLIEEEICSEDQWDERRREACLPLEFVVRMHWLEGQEFHDCKCLGWIAIEIQRENLLTFLAIT